MQYLTALLFEYSDQCNRSREHSWCPSGCAERWAHLDTSKHLEQVDIVRLAVAAWREFGFRGLFGFHCYNEPLMHYNKLMDIVGGISTELPESRFVLWTNGDYLREYMKTDLEKFETIVVTDYGNLDYELVNKTCPQAAIIKSKHDQRKIAEVDWYSQQETMPCLRPATELIVDYHGNLHFCCYDWRGLSSPGNILTDGLNGSIKIWRGLRDAIFTADKMIDLPHACRRCPYRDVKIQAYDEESAKRAIGHINEIRGVCVA